jgi:hypothetical protein
MRRLSDFCAAAKIDRKEKTSNCQEKASFARAPKQVPLVWSIGRFKTTREDLCSLRVVSESPTTRPQSEGVIANQPDADSEGISSKN